MLWTIFGICLQIGKPAACYFVGHRTVVRGLKASQGLDSTWEPA